MTVQNIGEGWSQGEPIFQFATHRRFISYRRLGYKNNKPAFDSLYLYTFMAHLNIPTKSIWVILGLDLHIARIGVFMGYPNRVD